eukprot:4782565-Alexandrium_andersonii.AAC.1
MWPRVPQGPGTCPAEHQSPRLRRPPPLRPHSNPHPRLGGPRRGSRRDPRRARPIKAEASAPAPLRNLPTQIQDMAGPCAVWGPPRLLPLLQQSRRRRAALLGARARPAVLCLA